MRILMFLSLLLVSVALAGPTMAHEERLAGGEWLLAGETGTGAPTLRFEAGRVSGLGGCNRFGGSYDQHGPDLSFSPLAATRMACAPEIMRKEQDYFAMLAKVRSFALSGDMLTLKNAAGGVLATFARRVAN